MSKVNQSNQVLANRSLGEIISSGFQLFGQTYLKIIGPFVLFSLLSIVLNIILLAPLHAMTYDYYLTQQTFLDWYFNLDILTRYETELTSGQIAVYLSYSMHLSIIGFLKGIIGGICTTLALCSVSGYLLTYYTKGDADLGMEMKISLSNPKVLKVVLFGAGLSTLYGVSGLDMMALMLIIPVIIIFCYFIFIIFTYNDKESENSFKEARLIASGTSLRIIGIFVIAQIISGLIQTVMVFVYPMFWTASQLDYLSWFSSSNFNIGLAFLNDVIIDSIAILFAPLFICLLTPLFVSSKARKEIGYRHQREQYVAWGSQSQGQQPARGGTRYGGSTKLQSPKRTQRPWEEKVAATKTAPIDQKQRRGGIYCPFCGILITSPKRYCPSCGEEVNLN